MKKSLRNVGALLWRVVLIFIGCAGDEDVSPEEEKRPDFSMNDSTFVPVEQATADLTAFIDELNRETRSAKKREISNLKSEPIIQGWLFFCRMWILIIV